MPKQIPIAVEVSQVMDILTMKVIDLGLSWYCLRSCRVFVLV